MGDYASDMYGDVRIINRGGQLTLILGPRKDAIALRHFNRDIFQAQLPWPSEEPSFVRFAIGADGKADLFTTDGLENSLETTFSRIEGEAPQPSHEQGPEE
jgi:hypothetical protein